MENTTPAPKHNPVQSIPSADASLLETISKDLDVHLFDGSVTIIVGGHLVSGSGNTVTGNVCTGSNSSELERARMEIKMSKMEIENLRQNLVDKERIISVLMNN